MGFIRRLLVVLLVKPVAYLLLGFSVVGREKLVHRGPAIIAANHNSHLDTALLFALFPGRLVPQLRPVAAADYFLQGKWLKWVSLNIIGVLPVERKSAGKTDPLDGARRALARGEILLLFPEGSRGAPENMSALKTGIAHLAQAFPEVPVVPVFLQGAGRSLPKGSALLVPFRCHAAIGEPLFWDGDRRAFMETLKARFEALESQIPALPGEETEPPPDGAGRGAG